MIRKAEVKDLEFIVELENRVLKSTLGYSFLLQELLENEFSRIYVFELESKIIGYISYRVVDENAELLNFLIDDNYQKQGYGSQLFTEVILNLNEEFAKTLILEVRESNEKAINFYKKYGAKEIKRAKNYYIDEDAIIMLLEVNQNDYSIS